MPDAADRETPSSNKGLFQKRYREVTVSAIIFGVVVGAIMNAAITYAGLKIGFTIVGSSIAAVLGFGVLRGLLRKGTILETNIGQTIASAVNTPNSGVIFTVPVLLLLGARYQFGLHDSVFWLLTLASVAGAILGCAFIVPLRKQMIDIERLRFPSALAVGAILKSPGAGPKKAVVLLVAVILAMLVYLPVALPGIHVEASLSKLDSYVERGKIKKDDAEHTRLIASWIENEQAPGDLVERGRLISEQHAADNETDTETDPAAATSDETSKDEVFSDDLAEAVYLATQGDAPWSSLRSRKLGWAAVPLWGYSDLNWRLSAKHLDDGSLDPSVDRDKDGLPDLILTDETFDVGRIFGLRPEMLLMFAITPLSLGAGYLTGRAGLLVLAGGVLAYIVLTPVAYSMNWLPAHIMAMPHLAPDFGRLGFNRPLGIGLLLGGAMTGIVASLPSMKEAFKSIASAGKRKGGSDELGLKVLAIASVVAVILLYFAADHVGRSPMNIVDPVTNAAVSADAPTSAYKGYTIGFASEQTHETWESWQVDQKNGFLKHEKAKPGLLAPLPSAVRSLLIALIGAGWIWFAGIIIAQCTGMTDWSPISGMALITVVLVLMLAGTGSVVGAVLIGTALCVAITCAADMMADLKTGYIVGAQPKRQQIVEIIATGIGPLITMATILLIAKNNMQTFGVPMGAGTQTTAPQAQALQAVITGMQGGEMPYYLYGFGALMGIVLGFGSFSGLGVLVGLSMYLPLIYILTYGVGCVINIIVGKIKGRSWAEEWGVPFAAGLIVGEAILALAVNSIVLLRG